MLSLPERNRLYIDKDPHPTDKIVCKIPANVNLKERFKAFYGRELEGVEERDLLIILSYIFSGLNGHNGGKKKEWIRMNTGWMQRGLSKFICVRIRTLLDLGIIDRKPNDWIIGFRSIPYRLVDHTEEYKTVDIVNKKMVNKLRKFEQWVKETVKNSVTFNDKEDESGGKCLITYVESSFAKVTLDEEKVSQTMESLKKNGASPESLEAYHENLERLRRGDFGAMRDKTAGRLHTCVTNMKSEFRKCLKMDGEELVEIDISYCQPTLLSHLIKGYRNEWSKYVELLQTHDFYDWISSETRTLGYNREKCKKAIFSQMLFCDNKTSDRSAFFAKFKQHFPKLSREMRGIKITNYKRLAVLLQRVESKLIIDGVLKKFSQEEIPCLTVHDAVLVKKSDLERAKAFMDQCLTDFLGFQPKLSVKY